MHCVSSLCGVCKARDIRHFKLNHFGSGAVQDGTLMKRLGRVSPAQSQPPGKASEAANQGPCHAFTSKGPLLCQSPAFWHSCKLPVPRLHLLRRLLVCSLAGGHREPP